MEKRTVSFVFALIFSFAINAQAVTIIEKLTPSSPTVRVEESASGCLFSYSPEGYVACTVRRSDLAYTAAKYYVPLDQRYYMPNSSGSATVNDLWFGFDFKYDPSSAGLAAGYIGIFNSDANNAIVSPAIRNCIGLEPHDLASLSLRVETNSGDGGVSVAETNTGAGINTTDSFRCRIHVYMSGSNSFADVQIFSVNALNQTSLLTSTTGLPVANGTNFWSGTNALGIRNITGLDTATKSIFYVDNMYFSTVGAAADANLAAPGWLAPVDANTLKIDNLNVSEDFRPQPADWQAIAQPQSGTYYIYDGNGFYSGGTRRKNVADSVAALYKPMPGRFYEPFNFNSFKFWSADEIFMGFDYKFLSGATAATFAVGLFNSESTNLSSGSRQNSIGLEFHSATSVALRAIGNTNWSTLYQSEPLLGTYPDSLGTYRFKIRVYSDVVANKTFIDVACYQFDISGNLSATPVFNSTGTVVADGTLGTPQKFLEGMNAFGVRNTSGSSSSQTKFYLDNMYISTEAAVNASAPSWLVPDCINIGDLNCDRAVNMLDLQIITSNWLSTTVLTADLNNSGRIDFPDFAKFAAFWMSN